MANADQGILLENNKKNNTASPENSTLEATDFIKAYVLNDSNKPLFSKIINDDSTPIYVTSSSSSKSKKSLSENPKLDVLTSAESLDVAVPAGFLILHNDIKSLIKKQSVGGSGQSVEISDGDAPFKISLSGIVKDILVKKGGTTTLIKGGTGLATKAFAPAIANLGKVASFLTNPYVLGTVAAGAAVALLVNYVKNSEQREAEDHMKHLMNEMTMSMTLQDLLGNQDALDARNNAFIEYMKSYYNAQIRNMQMESFMSGVVGSIGSAVNSFIVNLFGINEENPMETKVKELTNLLDTSTDTAALAIDPDLITIRNTAFKEYTQTYYDTQINELAKKGEGSAAGGKAGSFINSFFTNIFGADKTASLQDKMEILLNNLNNNLDVSEKSPLLSNEDILNAQLNGITSYIETYYDAQATALADKEISTGWGESFKGFFKGLFGADRDKEEDASTKKVLKSIVNISSYIDSSDFDDIKIASLKNFVQSYFDTLISNTNISGAGLNSNNINSLNYTFLNVLEDSLNDIKSVSLNDKISQGIGTFVETYFSDLTKNTNIGKLDQKDISEINYAFKNAIKNALGDRKNIKAEAVFEALANKDSENLLNEGNGQILVNDVSTIKTFIMDITGKIGTLENYLASINQNTGTPSAPTIIPISSSNKEINLEV